MTRETIIIITMILLSSLKPTGLFAQNLESIGQKDPLKVTGGISTNHVFYHANDSNYLRDPYNYYLTGNINFDLYGWSVPFTYSYSNQSSSFQQPFNQYGLHPTYKWLTGHFGYNSMTFSPYTLSGHLYSGIGLDLTPPGKFKFSAMYGRLQKAVPLDTNNNDNSSQYAAYQRIGYGLKVGFKHQADFIDLIFFKSKDDINSIPFVPEEEGILPEENLVLSFVGGKTIAKKIAVTIEFASSAITSDIRSEESDSVNNIYKHVGGLFTPRISSSYYKAFKSGIKYNMDKMSFGLGYERIDPGYRTHGAYYFNNDLENITLDATARLLKDKVNLGFNIGKQRDNLNNAKVSRMTRTVSSVNIGYTANEKLNFNASYSNFQSYTNVRSNFIDINQATQWDNLDTLNFTQISRNFNLNTSYIISSNEKRRQHLNVNLSVQVASDEQESQVAENSGSQFYNINSAYSYSIIPVGLTVTSAFNANINHTQDIEAHTLGPTLAVNKSFFEKKMRTTFSTSYNKSFANGTGINRMFNIRFNNTYAMKKKHNFNLNMVMAFRKSFGENARNLREFTATFGYSYNF